MSLLDSLRYRWRVLIHPRSYDREMDEEFRSHIAHRADHFERRGLSREAAERAARIEFGAVEAQKDEARDARGLRAVIDRVVPQLWAELQAAVFDGESSSSPLILTEMARTGMRFSERFRR